MSPGPCPGSGDGLGMQVLERGWLSANQVVFAAHDDQPATVVDTGFCTHAAQTVALVRHALGGALPGRIVNTHLHSDHCGGNAEFQRLGTLETWVPRASFEAASRWDEDALSYRLTDQPCPRFSVQHALEPGQELPLGPARWRIYAAPGHDPDAVLLFEPQTRTLLSGDALWEQRLAIIFPELTGDAGFGPARDTLELIERLAPLWVVPGHGRPFEDVAGALSSSRARLTAFERAPERHRQHACRALLMFHLLEVRRMTEAALIAWMLATPIFRETARRHGLSETGTVAWARSQVRGLVDDGVLAEQEGQIVLPVAST